MHIHLIASGYPPMLGGISRAASRCARLLKQLGHKVSVTAPSMNPEQTLGFDADQHREMLPLFSDLSRMPELAERVLQRIEQPPDVFIGYGLLPAGHTAATVGARLGIPAVVSVRGNDLALFVYRFPDFVLKTLEQASAVIFVASSLQRLALGLLPNLAPRSTVVLNSVDIACFEAVPSPCPPKDQLIVGTSGILRWKKGIDLFLQVCKGILAACPGVQVRIAGYPLASEMESIARLIQQAGLAERLHWSGPLDCAGMSRELRKMDLYLQCSYREGTPNALLEAMALGLPVVAAAADGVAEVVRSGVDGYLVPLGDVESMIRYGVELLRDPMQRERLGRAAAIAMRSRHHPSREAAQIEDVLYRAVSSRRSSV